MACAAVLAPFITRFGTVERSGQTSRKDQVRLDAVVFDVPGILCHRERHLCQARHRCRDAAVRRLPGRLHGDADERRGHGQRRPCLNHQLARQRRPGKRDLGHQPDAERCFREAQLRHQDPERLEGQGHRRVRRGQRHHGQHVRRGARGSVRHRSAQGRAHPLRRADTAREHADQGRHRGLRQQRSGDGDRAGRRARGFDRRARQAVCGQARRVSSLCRRADCFGSVRQGPSGSGERLPRGMERVGRRSFKRRLRCGSRS